MPAVFVHGVPESAAIWDELIPHLERTDVIALSPPGFGAAVPADFGATADDYRDWLLAELSAIDGPIDLVGHDWGGLLVLRVAMERPDLLQSWATDVAGGLDPDYVWHDLAKIWQTPAAGEQFVAQMATAPLQARAQRFESGGMSGATALKISGAFNEAMGRCILALYRSAAQPAMANWGKHLADAAAKPGLVIAATHDDMVGGEVMATRSAATCGASVTQLKGLGHWWMSQDPERGAAALTAFWSTLSK